jgi:predicted nucleic-acid-binding protein
MVAVDTNVLVRFIVDDDPAQCKRAKALIQRCIRDSNRIFISDVVVCETVWVLERAYRLSKDEVARVLGELLSSIETAFEEPENFQKALELYESKKGDFADYLILSKASEAGCSALYTFDEKLLEEDLAKRP